EQVAEWRLQRRLLFAVPVGPEDHVAQVREWHRPGRAVQLRDAARPLDVEQRLGVSGLDVAQVVVAAAAVPWRCAAAARAHRSEQGGVRVLPGGVLRHRQKPPKPDIVTPRTNARWATRYRASRGSAVNTAAAMSTGQLV